MKINYTLSICTSLVLMLLFCNTIVVAQYKLRGSYVAVKITYLSDEELPDENLLKYSYIKYTFTDPDKINYSSVYFEQGAPFFYEIASNKLVIKSEGGSVINTLKILSYSDNQLVLVGASVRGSLEDHNSIKYLLYREPWLQQNMALTADDLYSIKEKDTVFRSGQKVYAHFKGDSFQSYMYQQVRKKIGDTRKGSLNSTFIINENGVADSLKILESISAKHTEAYKKAFASAKNMWSAAIVNGKFVKVMMSQNLRYSTSEEVLPSYFISQQANDAYQQKDYQLALYLYDKALASKADEPENLYRRGICKQMLGNNEGACTDWKSVKALGENIADELIAKYCGL